MREEERNMITSYRRATKVRTSYCTLLHSSLASSTDCNVECKWGIVLISHVFYIFASWSFYPFCSIMLIFLLLDQLLLLLSCLTPSLSWLILHKLCTHYVFCKLSCYYFYLLQETFSINVELEVYYIVSTLSFCYCVVWVNAINNVACKSSIAESRTRIASLPWCARWMYLVVALMIPGKQRRTLFVPMLCTIAEQVSRARICSERNHNWELPLSDLSNSWINSAACGWYSLLRKKFEWRSRACKWKFNTAVVIYSLYSYVEAIGLADVNKGTAFAFPFSVDVA